MLVFLPNTVSFFSHLSKISLFLTQIMKKYAIVKVATEKKIISDTEAINMWI